jgi:tetratricopeptide (TPR) repeat protein
MQAVKQLLQLDRPFKPEDVAMAGAAHAEASLLEQLDPWSADWALLRGQLAMAQNEPIRARGYFERALALDPENVLVRVRLADMLFETGVEEKESRPNSAREDFLAAERMLDAAIERDRRSKLAWLYKGIHRLVRSTWEDEPEASLKDALRNFEEAIAIDGRFELAHRNKGIALAMLGEMEAAEAAFNRSLEVEPDSFGALTQLSQLYGARDEYETALLFARKATEANPGSLQAWTWRANVEQDFGRVKSEAGEMDDAQVLLDAAVASYGMAIDLDPRSADVRIERSKLLFDLGRQALAGADARQAVVLAPSDPYAWMALAKYQDAIGETKAAQRSLAELLVLDEKFDMAHELLAKLHLKSGDAAAAARSITAAIDHAEEDFRAQFLAFRARIRIGLGDGEDALADAVAARSAEPESFDYWLLEAEILIETNRFGEACEALAEANQRKPGSEEVARRRAEAGCF